MQINNSSINRINLVQGNLKSESKNAQIELPQKSFELPDIRANQILLPDNKILLPQGVKPANFNKDNISVEVPKHYKLTSNSNPAVEVIQKIYKNSKVEQYINLKNGDERIRISSNKFNDENVLDSSEVLEFSTRNTKYGIKYIKDYEHNSETEMVISNPINPRKQIINSITTLYKDTDGKVTKTEQYTKSPYLKGVYDITETDANGKETIVSKTTKKDNGTIVLERNLVSLDGTKTNYRYETDADGMHKKMFCRITDKDGKVLSTIDRTYDKENENETYSSINGNKFKISKNSEGVEITDYTKNTVTNVKQSDFETSFDTKLFISMLDDSKRKREFSNENVTEKLLDTLPADTILTMHDKIKEIVPLKDDLDSAFMGVFGYLMCKTDNFVVNHELGHSKDAVKVGENDNLLELKAENVVADKTSFYSAYVEEKAAFVKEFPDFQEKFINYFLHSPKTKSDIGRKETVAESNAINGLQPEEPEVLAMRTIVLQRYFPRSMAALTNMMNPVAVEQ